MEVVQKCRLILERQGHSCSALQPSSRLSLLTLRADSLENNALYEKLSVRPQAGKKVLLIHWRPEVTAEGGAYADFDFARRMKTTMA